MRRKEKIEKKGRKGVLNDEHERSDNPRGSSNSVREAEGGSLFHSVHDRTNFNERVKALPLLALLDMHQSKPMRVNMKKPVELEPMKRIDKIRRFSNKELRLNKESMGALPKSKEYCEPIRKKSYSYVSGIIGIAYNPFLNEDIRDCFFDYEQAAWLRFWTSRIATIRRAANQ